MTARGGGAAAPGAHDILVRERPGLLRRSLALSAGVGAILAVVFFVLGQLAGAAVFAVSTTLALTALGLLGLGHWRVPQLAIPLLSSITVMAISVLFGRDAGAGVIVAPALIAVYVLISPADRMGRWVAHGLPILGLFVFLVSPTGGTLGADPLLLEWMRRFMAVAASLLLLAALFLLDDAMTAVRRETGARVSSLELEFERNQEKALELRALAEERSKLRFEAGIAHEFNTPLQSATANLEALDEMFGGLPGDAGTQGRASVQLILREVSRIAVITESVQGSTGEAR